MVFSLGLTIQFSTGGFHPDTLHQEAFIVSPIPISTEGGKW
eukprot:CAMPEP_0178446368 /NCGR_PEP_ID=MMETSP0689_2-20121128/40762_1 /TAXON_ID=160604 /ORGANISM="Amphidinium massartii, Strain CS-259" /LENGTH=40 /DNA_ID= /DNA_START= /DNA_END= /DNA_ORIENTATION=